MRLDSNGDRKSPKRAFLSRDQQYLAFCERSEVKRLVTAGRIPHSPQRFYEIAFEPFQKRAAIILQDLISYSSNPRLLVKIQGYRL